jgi:hypothetical protein
VTLTTIQDKVEFQLGAMLLNLALFLEIQIAYKMLIIAALITI